MPWSYEIVAVRSGSTSITLKFAILVYAGDGDFLTVTFQK